MRFRDHLLRPWYVRCLLAVAFAMLSSGALFAQSAVVHVEEDWELLVDEPDPDSGSPQVSCVISPNEGTDGLHAVFTINHESLPEYASGGLQLQVWNGDEPLLDRRHPAGQLMESPNEVVRWTQSMKIRKGQLTFEITEGNSSTWGDFGGRGYLKASVETTLSHLDDYDPLISANNSGVIYAGNRVIHLELLRVRYRDASGRQWEVPAEQVVHVRE